VTRTLNAAVIVFLTSAAPALARADHGILILAPSGTDEWNAQVTALTAAANAQKPTELALGTPARSTIEAAVARLVTRGAADVTAVPFFLPAALAPELATGYPVPLRLASSPADDPVLADVMMSRAQAISRTPSDEMVVIVGYGADDNGTPWSVNLAPTAQRLNQARRFASIFLVKPAHTEAEQQQVRLVLEKFAGSQKRILVVSLLTPPSGGDLNLMQSLQGYSYDVATSGAISDPRLVDWLISRTAAQ